MAVNGSVTPVEFRYTSPAGYASHISRANILIMCSNPLPSQFGCVDLSAGNGLLFEIVNNNDVQLLDLLDGDVIKNHSHFSHLAGVDVMVDGGAGNDAISIRWTFERTGSAIILGPGQYIQATVRDNLTALPHFEIMVQGYREKI